MSAFDADCVRRVLDYFGQEADLCVCVVLWCEARVDGDVLAR